MFAPGQIDGPREAAKHVRVHSRAAALRAEVDKAVAVVPGSGTLRSSVAGILRAGVRGGLAVAVHAARGFGAAAALRIVVRIQPVVAEILGAGVAVILWEIQHKVPVWGPPSPSVRPRASKSGAARARGPLT